MNASVNVERNSWRLPPDETVQVADPRSKSAQVKEDLTYAEGGHNWRSIVFSLLVIGFVIAGIVTAIYLLGYVDELLYWSGKRLTLEECLRGDLTPHRLPPAWLSHDKFVFQADDGSLALLDTSNNSVSLLVSNHTLRQLNVQGYQCSSDLRYVLFKHNVKPVFRHSFTAHYTVYDVTNDHHTPLRLNTSPRVQQTRLQFAAWLGNTTSLLMISDNDIYLRATPSAGEDTRLTDTGIPGVVYNGVPDWLYQEEVLPRSEVVWPSPSGSHILFASFNDTRVSAFQFPWFGTPVGQDGADAGPLSSSRQRTFPPSRSVRYPTPGSPNPEVDLWLVDLANATAMNGTNTTVARTRLKPPPIFDGQEYYLISAGWVGNDATQISVVWMTRSQNLSVVSGCHAPSWNCEETHSERAPEGQWLDAQPHPVFAPDGDSFLLLAAVQEGSQEHFTHIKHVTLTQQRIAVISHGRYEVSKILAWDTQAHLVYYLGTRERRPGQRHLYVVQDPTTEEPRRLEPLCVTCDLGGVLWSSRLYYTNCTHFGGSVSPFSESGGQGFYVLHCEGPGLPLAGVHSVITHKMVRVLYDTRVQRADKLSQLALPTRKSFEIPLPQGWKAQVQLLLPPSWREELRDAAFPVLVEVNGRPGSEAVTDRFGIDWGTYMSSHNDVVYVRLDVRGARGQGKRALFRRIGGVEVQDQLTVLRHLLDTFKYLDETRVGVWGWGYGGYVTAMVLGSQQNVFKCGVAVSPIADWLYYNSAFTERVLGAPSENYKGYVEADLTQRARLVPSHSLYLLHGLADLTAPYTHGVAFAKALAEAGVIFRYQSYADEDHELTGVIEHAYRSMEDFLAECLTLEPS
ncbi:inactive dipeptidyl peptidase 10 isoform X1 [Neodiprion pinetum]|uniref:Inactive dipeptidyl peptidase 10 isoform X1 n=1 Tax=Neodiprion lecontei TaxID=441921 RepID=A0A6J0BMU7_NEOLC|nr:inactive dipeptidyl peptidase 10 isoform X1 [Neodiprion lecontei]XP_046481603.1 inactive dipeptidyl peptidase 10 isoform X1 [Neodiprion pinetum]XP_046481604.1 inactive dipeptidyl peptidase 10 isoform X1 [Neodiprion pinetum]XP_046481605.1 inactive dipeptidyl peptidase 10 isoform X1 [Neodiprion pinetum]XP_046481606.1 inactive dipeptidyl peptidase 10 isoform X1 [Neodiprion pinetum]XP_046481608.1 inactive dipeptidyl peptidase 10 isoform X1 [Neodiprion pinetum]XP_046481609.1 inactive dipeptidyl